MVRARSRTRIRIRRTAALLVPVLVAAGTAAVVTTVAHADAEPSEVALTRVAAADRAQALAYWTPDRMRSTGATSLDRPEVVGRAWTGQPPSGVGRLLMVVKAGAGAAGVDEWCTATAVPSPNRDVVVTAAHCVWPGYNRADELIQVSKVVFVPGYASDAMPHGVFAARAYLLPVSYQQHSSPDVAMIVLDQANGRHVADAAGTQNITFAATAPGATAIFGYPGSKDARGQVLKWCNLPAEQDGNPDRWRVTCDMAGGSSGGPWLTGFQAATGAGTIYSVTSSGTLDVDANGDLYTTDLVGSKLETVAATVYEQAGKQ